MPEPKPSISLTIELPDGTHKVLEFTGNEPIMIGSGASAQVQIKADDVSSLHCMIKPKDGGQVAVLDLGSDDGTMLNGKEIAGETPLSDGDSVKVGKAKIGVHFGGDMLAPTVPIRRAVSGGHGHEAALSETTTPMAFLDGSDARGADVTSPDPHALPVAADPAPAPITMPPTPGIAAPNGARAANGNGHAAPAPAPVGNAKPAAPVAQQGQASMKTEKIERPKDLADKPAPKKNAPMDVNKTEAALAKMPTRHVQREVTGKKLNTARRSMVMTKGKAGRLSPALGADEKPSDRSTVDVTMLWGGTVMGVQRVAGSGTITIGDAPTAGFRISHASIPSTAHPLVQLSAQGVVVNAVSGMEVVVDKKPVAAGQIKLDVGQEATVRVGAIEFVVQYSKKYRAIDLGLFQTLDFFYSKVFAIALIAQLGFVLAMILTPRYASLDEDDLFKNQNDFVKLVLQAQEKKMEKKDLSGKKAAQHKDDAGVFGKKDKPKEDKLASKKGAPTVDKDKREEDRKIAMDALKALGLQGPEGAVSNVFGPGGLGTGINNALGGLKGASMGDAGGAGGLGSRGTGAGGGGNALGIGGIGSGTGRGSGGNGNIDLGGRGKGMTRIVPGKIIYEGGLSREEIQRVISRVMSQIKYCYEKELTKDPNLEGKLVASWTIAGTGDVATAQMAQNTMGNQAVEQCVLRIIQRLKFPNPKGGGQVFVTYPFVFSAAGE